MLNPPSSARRRKKQIRSKLGDNSRTNVYLQEIEWINFISLKMIDWKNLLLNLLNPSGFGIEINFYGRFFIFKNRIS